MPCPKGRTGERVGSETARVIINCKIPVLVYCKKTTTSNRGGHRGRGEKTRTIIEPPRPVLSLSKGRQDTNKLTAGG